MSPSMSKCEEERRRGGGGGICRSKGVGPTKAGRRVFEMGRGNRHETTTEDERKTKGNTERGTEKKASAARARRPVRNKAGSPFPER